MTRGINAERDLVNILWKKGFAVMRAPASGSATKRPLPDIIAGSKKRGLQFVIEVKTTHLRNLYVEYDCIHQLLEFAETFGCEPYLATKFRGQTRDWIFIKPNQLQSTKGMNFKITFEKASAVGIDLKTLIGEGRQARFET